MNTQAGTNTAPGIFWVISLVSLVWNAFGLMVYWLTQIRYPAVMAQTPPAMIKALDNAGALMTGAWGLAVTAAVAGSILLVARRRWAVAAFALSLAGLLVLTAYQLASDMPMNVLQVVLIWVIALFLWRYAVKAGAAGLLR